MRGELRLTCSLHVPRDLQSLPCRARGHAKLRGAVRVRCGNLALAQSACAAWNGCSDGEERALAMCRACLRGRGARKERALATCRSCPRCATRSAQRAPRRGGAACSSPSPSLCAPTRSPAPASRMPGATVLATSLEAMLLSSRPRCGQRAHTTRACDAAPLRGHRASIARRPVGHSRTFASPHVWKAPRAASAAIAGGRSARTCERRGRGREQRGRHRPGPVAARRRRRFRERRRGRHPGRAPVRRLAPRRPRQGRPASRARRAQPGACRSALAPARRSVGARARAMVRGWCRHVGAVAPLSAVHCSSLNTHACAFRRQASAQRASRSSRWCTGAASSPPGSISRPSSPPRPTCRTLLQSARCACSSTALRGPCAAAFAGCCTFPRLQPFFLHSAPLTEPVDLLPNVQPPRPSPAAGTAPPSTSSASCMRARG